MTSTNSNHRTRERLERLGVALIVALLLAVTAYGVAVARHYRSARTELGAVSVTRLDERTQQRLEDLEDSVFLTYYVTTRERMPSHLKRLEREVTDFLETLKEQSGGRVDYQVVDPESDNPDSEDLEAYAAKRRVSPFPVRSVTRDAYTEQTIYSSLTLAYGAHEPAQINGLTLEHLPRLQSLFVEQLDQMESPRRGLVALAPKQGYSQLHASLSELADVVRVDLDGESELPARVLEADALFWIDAREVDPNLLRDLNEYIESGRSLVIAGSSHEAEIQLVDGREPELVLTRSGYPAGELLSEFGLRPVETLVGDKFNEGLSLGAAEDALSLPAPFQVRCIAPNQDFHNLQNQPNGNLLFYAPTPFEQDDERLAQLAWSAQILATTSDETWTQPIPDGPLPLSATTKENGEFAPKLPLIALLRPNDPWQGMVFALASATPFRDGTFERPEGGVAHWRLARTLVDNLLSRERLVLTQVSTHRPQPLPSMSAGTRLFWRIACVALVPLLLGGFALKRGAFQLGARTKESVQSGASARRRGLGLTALAVLAVLLLTKLVGWIGLRQDLTADRIHELAPETRAIAALEGEVEIELWFSAAESLPPNMRQLVRSLRERLRDFGRAGADLSIHARSPEDLDEAELDELAAQGIEPLQVVTEDESQKTVRTIWSALRLTRGERTEVLRFPDARAFEDLEFRLAFALWRLETGRRPKVGFAPDVPRPSSAEAYEYYQTQGLFSPMGHNVNSLAMETLEEAGFDVEFINPRNHPDELPPDLDALVWVQPRRNVTKLMDLAVEYLHSGGKMLLAAQHFRMQARQYRGRDFDTVYWPQPQSPDVEGMYYPDLGLHMVREVLFDDLMIPMEQPVRVMGRGSARLFEPHTLTQHTQIRGVAANFAPDSNITHGLSDQGLLWANFIDLDLERMAELGLTHEVLLSTSERTWSFDWKGGWLPNDLVSGPPGATLRLRESDDELKNIVLPQGLQRLGGYTGALWDLAFHPGGELLATAGEDRVVRLWSLPDGEQLGALPGPRKSADAAFVGHSTAVRHLAFLPDGERLLSGGADGALILWEHATGTELGRLLSLVQGGIQALALSPDGAHVAVSTGDGRVRLQRSDELVAADGTVPESLELEGQADVVLALAFSADGELVAGGGRDGRVQLWDTTSGARLHMLELAPESADPTMPPPWVRTLAAAPDGRMAAGTSDGRVVFLDPAAGTITSERRLEATWVRHLSFSPDGSTLAAALGFCEPSRVGEETEDVERDEGASAFEDLESAAVVLLDGESGELVRALDDHGPLVRRLRYSPAGDTLAVAEGLQADPRNFEPEEPLGRAPEMRFAGQERRQRAFLGKLPVAVSLEGQFPLPEDFYWQPPQAQPAPETSVPELGPSPIFDMPSEEEQAQRARREALVPAPGQLVFLACSQMLWNDRLTRADARADHLLLNAVAELCLPPELARLSGRRPALRGFDYVPPEQRLVWRARVLSGGPIAILLLGLLRYFLRRRPDTSLGSARS